MQENTLMRVNIIIYYNQSIVTTCKPNHVGIMGIFLKDIHLGFPIGTALEIKFIGHKYEYVKDSRIPMVVNHSEANGTGLRLEKFEKDVVQKWKRILKTITKPFVTKKHKEEVDVL